GDRHDFDGDRRRLRARLQRRTAAVAAHHLARLPPPADPPRRGGAELARLMPYIGFRHHLGLKFVSIALAALLWVAVAGEQTVEGEPADGFVVGTVTAEPSTVEVLGPVSVLSRMTQAITEPVTVAGASAPVTETVNIGVADTSVRLRTPQMARVAVVVAPAPVEWSVGDIPVKL